MINRNLFSNGQVFLCYKNEKRHFKLLQHEKSLQQLKSTKKTPTIVTLLNNNKHFILKIYIKM